MIPREHALVSPLLATVFAVLSAAAVALAFAERGIFWALLWPAVAGTLVATAYIRGDPALLGKRADGTIPAWRVLLLLPYFAGAWGGWHLMRWLAREQCFHEIAPGLFLGRRPLPGELPEGVTLVVDLTAEFQSLVTPLVPEYLLVAALDGTVPPRTAFRDAVERVARHEGSVYIHCAAGRGRATAFVSAVLLARGLAPTVRDAERLVKSIRPWTSLSTVQRRLVRELEPVTRS